MFKLFLYDYNALKEGLEPITFKIRLRTENILICANYKGELLGLSAKFTEIVDEENRSNNAPYILWFDINSISRMSMLHSRQTYYIIAFSRKSTPLTKVLRRYFGHI